MRPVCSPRSPSTLAPFPPPHFAPLASPRADDVREREVEDLFAKYGRIRSVDLKNPVRPPAFAFIEFDDPR